MKNPKMGKRPKEDPARNTVYNVGLAKGKAPEDNSPASLEEKNRVTDANSYHDDTSSRELDGVIDRSTKKPYGQADLAWAEKNGKMGKLDPKESDLPPWTNTWSECVDGKGFGYTNDENYGVTRPRTFSRQKDSFEEYNPEFQNGAGEGDWTNYKWSPNV